MSMCGGMKLSNEIKTRFLPFFLMKNFVCLPPDEEAVPILVKGGNFQESQNFPLETYLISSGCLSLFGLIIIVPLLSKLRIKNECLKYLAVVRSGNIR